MNPGLSRGMYEVPKDNRSSRPYDGPHDKSHTTEEPNDAKGCAMVRTEWIASRGGRSSRQMTSRRPILPDSERIGNNSLMGKRERSEDVYGLVLQRLRDMVKAGLPAP
jgi:hypothetical protein